MFATLVALAASLVALVALAGPIAGSAAARAPAGRVAIVFAPGPPPEAKPSMIERLAAIGGLKLGFMSAIMGSYSPEQVLLDIGAGSRTWTSLYEGDLVTPMRLLGEGRDASISGWAVARKRATTAPADIRLGTLAETLAKAGQPVAYLGLDGRANREAIVAARRDGTVARAVLASRQSIAREAPRLWGRSRLLVAAVPAGRDGARAVTAILTARRPADLVLVIQQPTGVPRRLPAIGAAGLEGGSNLSSDSTRIDGLVVSVDVTATALDHLAPGSLADLDDVTGEPIEARGDRSVDELSRFRDRLAAVGPRRWSVVLLGLAGAGLLAVAAGLLEDRRSPRRATRRGRETGRGRVVRAALLTALWLPFVLLLTGALAPSATVEAMLIAVGAGGLGIASDHIGRWTTAVTLAASVTVVAHLVDLALGSTYTAQSLLGPNPILGARFYGIGNELEVTLTVVSLLGIGAAFARATARATALGFVAIGGALALALSWGRLGADVGASLMIAAGVAAAVLAARGRAPRRRDLVLVALAPVLALGLLALLDLTTGGDSHFTRSVLNADDRGDVLQVAQRRLELSFNSLRRPAIALLVAIAVAALIWGVRSRRRLLEPLNAAPGARAALIGTLVAVVFGALANDSGPIILIIGTSYLALAVGYFQAVLK